jgi:hypothetical protein
MVVTSTGTQWSGEIYLETDLASLSTAWFSTTLSSTTIKKLHRSIVISTEAQSRIFGREIYHGKLLD